MALSKEQLHELIEDIEALFGASVEAFSEEMSRRNQDTALPYIQKWGKDLAWYSIAWLVDDMRVYANGQMQSVFIHSQTGENILDNALEQHMQKRLGILMDLLQAYSCTFTELLVPVIEHATDEDMKAISAFVLTSRIVNEITQPGKWMLIQQFKRTYAKLEGTSCKFSVAFLLCLLGDDTEYKKIIEVVYSKELITSLSKIMETIPVDLRKIALYGEIALPGWSRIPTGEDFTNPYKAHRFGIMGTIALDIASNGKAFNQKIWRRKQYR